MLNNKVGRHFARALVAVVEENGTINFPDDGGERWDPGIFSENVERPHQEQIFYEMMKDEAVDITHWYQQIGFNRRDVRCDFKRLTMEEPGSRDITLLSLRSRYPVIFSALYATFALMPSTTRLTEQSHGALRDSLPMGVSMMFTDARQAYMMDEEYHNREARRKKKRQEKKNGPTNFGVKHDDTKALQIESAEATTRKSKEYQKSKIDGLPDSVKSSIVIRGLKKAGILKNDKKLDCAKLESAMEKQAKRFNSRRGNQLPTLIALQESSKAREIDNDKTWANESTEVMQRKQDLERYAEFNFWNQLPGKEGFKDVLKKTLPKFWKPEFGGAGVTLKAIRDQLKQWLERVRLIVKKEAPNDALLGDIDISALDKYGILALFVDIENASYLKDKREKARRKAAFIGKLFETNGSVVLANKRYQVRVKAWAEIDSDSSDSGDDENE
jgi:hypothetical protein